VQCDHYDAGRCRSCTLLPQPYPTQLALLQGKVAQTLATHVDSQTWEPRYAGPPVGFRNKAKLVVGGQRGSIKLGIPNPDHQVVGLTNCGLYEAGLATALPVLNTFVDQVGLTPYDISRRSGEFKYLLVTHSPSGELMVRFVLRSEGQAERLRTALPDLCSALPQLRVATINYLPEPKALLEGDQEEFLSVEQELPLSLPQVTLLHRPQSFFQTNTQVATALYETAQRWLTEIAPKSVVDLYCGIGGFTFHAAAAAPAARILGIEQSPEAIKGAAQARAQNCHLTPPRFLAQDAELWLTEGDSNLLIVNPPRRGIGLLATEINRSRVPWLLYSSCNPGSLAKDLSELSNYRVTRAQLFDMFPHTEHCEVLILAHHVGAR
jgi:23S rRNA (uracil747-C5)-methyltransferase